MFVRVTPKQRARNTAEQEAPPASPLTVANLVAKASLNVALALDVVLRLCGGRCKGKGFRDCVIRLQRPRVTAQLFANGRIVVIGAKRGDEALWAMHQVAARLRPAHPNIILTNFRVCNLVLSQSLGCKLDLERLERGCGLACVYTPDLFPGVHITPGQNRPIVIAFRSGRIVVTGATDLGVAARTVAELKLTQYRQQPGGPQPGPQGSTPQSSRSGQPQNEARTTAARETAARERAHARPDRPRAVQIAPLLPAPQPLPVPRPTPKPVQIPIALGLGDSAGATAPRAGPAGSSGQLLGGVARAYPRA